MKKHFVSVLAFSPIFLSLLMMSSVLWAATELKGTVNTVGKGEVIVEIGKGTPTSDVPSNGDHVQFMLTIPDLNLRTKSGTGSVVRVNGKRITVRVADGKPSVGHEATIQATGKPSTLRTTPQSSPASSSEPSQSSDIGLTPSRIATLSTLLNSEDVSHELRNAICLKEQWCLAGHNTLQSSECGHLGSFVRICSKRAAGRASLSFGSLNRDTQMDQACQQLWSKLSPEDWQVLDAGKPCREPLPDALRVAVFTEEEASCVAKYECEGKSGKKLKRCEKKYLKCTQNQIALDPMERESCRKKRENVDPEEPVQQCLRPTTSPKKASVRPDDQKPNVEEPGACKQMIGFWLPEKKDKNVDYIELAWVDSTGSVKRSLRAVGAKSRMGSWECLDSTKGQVSLDLGDNEPYPATMTTESKTQRARLCIDGESICFLRSVTRPVGK